MGRYAYGRREVLRSSLGIGLLAIGTGGLLASGARPAFAETTFEKLQRSKSVSIGIANE